MKKISLILSFMFLSIGLFGCQRNNDEKVDNAPSITENLETKAEVTEGEFVYRLVTEKAEYGEDEPMKIYAELEYIGDKEEIEISHAASPFHFPMVETTRNYEIGYGMDQPSLSTVILKGEPLRTEYRGSGGYGSQDKKEYIEFMKRIMNQEFPEGHYVVNGIADFGVIANEGTEQKKEYKIKGQVEFRVSNSNQQNSEINNPKKPYDSEEAIENGDVVNRHGEISNLDKFENFIKNVESGTKDEIRITMYTIEGDPIFYNLNYDGNKIQYTYDDSQDGYAGSGKGIKSTSCSNIESRNTENGVEYHLSECSSEVGNTFYFQVSE
ncbi:DUF4362 domain-containing protein [Peribacillus loiseleuriae]|uniref:DUF4362 domain-containing protein n=1 Tax=Peribacillus loiseleuriae TaxID=1679170 RepID=UPI00069FAC18|nr:DUF4362 domain-containing protein [Peribacillus loiseleuriae]